MEFKGISEPLGQQGSEHSFCLNSFSAILQHYNRNHSISKCSSLPRSEFWFRVSVGFSAGCNLVRNTHSGINYPGAPNGRFDFDDSQFARNMTGFTTSPGVMFFAPF